MTAGTSLLSFVTCASNDATLRTNLLASPCLAPDLAHQVVAVRNCPSAADGLNIGIARAETEWVVCHHNLRSVGLPAAFFASAQVFAWKWRHRLPVATPCAIIDRGGIVHVLGNATTEGKRSIACTLN